MNSQLSTKSFDSYIYRCGNKLLKICALHGAAAKVETSKSGSKRTITVTCDEALLSKIETEWLDSMKITNPSATLNSQPK